MEGDRAAERAAALTAAHEARARGDAAAANGLYARAVDVSPQLAHAFLHVLRRRGIPFVVAPYEADAQLGFLCLRGVIDAVITEDSDLLVYGAPRVLYKMGGDGEGQEIVRARLPECGEVNLRHMSGDQFVGNLTPDGVGDDAWRKEAKVDGSRQRHAERLAEGVGVLLVLGLRAAGITVVIASQRWRGGGFGFDGEDVGEEPCAAKAGDKSLPGFGQRLAHGVSSTLASRSARAARRASIAGMGTR